MRTRRIFALQGLHVSGDRILPRLHRDGQHLDHIALRIGIVLVPRDAGCHAEELLDGDPVIAAADQLRNIGGDRVLQRSDLSVPDRRANQRGGEAFGHRETGPPIGRLQAQPIALQHDLAVLDYHQSGDLLGLHERGHGGIVDGQRRAFGQRKRLGRRLGCGARKNILHPPEIGRALFIGPEQDLRPRLLNPRHFRRRKGQRVSFCRR